MFDCPCVILAGGKSSRMKTDKALLPFKHYNSLCEYQVVRLKPLFSSLYVSCKSDKFDFEVDLILDSEEAYSPMIALKNILFKFHDESIFIIGVDIPFVCEEEIHMLYSYVNNYDAIIPKTPKFTHQMCGFYHSKLATLSEKLVKNNEHKIRNLLEKSHVKYVDFYHEEVFSNLNFLDDYNKANE